MKNIVIAVIIVLSVGLAAWYYGNRPADTVPKEDRETQRVEGQEPETPATATTIIHTDSGFTPASVTVKVGEPAKWVNEGSERMWVASDPHPVHTNYQGFDQKSGGEKGTVYTFTFTKAGEWRYHNHLNPQHRGVVNVTP